MCQTMEFREVEYRTPKNLEKQIYNLFRDKPNSQKEAHIIDAYTHYNPKTGDLSRLRLINDGERFRFYSMKKIGITGCHPKELPEKELTAAEYDNIKSNSIIIGEIEGKRKTLNLNGITFCFDEIYKLGDFTELEILVKTKEEVPKAKEKIYGIANTLGINKSDLTTKNYPDMMIERGLWKPYY